MSASVPGWRVTTIFVSLETWIVAES